MKKKHLLLILLMTLLAPWAVAQQSLPYSYGFEDNNLSTDGWTSTCTSSNSGINTNAAHSGNYGFTFYYSETSGYLVSPLLTGATNGLDLSFYYREYSSSYGDEQFRVGYTTDASNTDPSTFTYGDVVTASTSWQTYTNSFPAGTVRIAVQYIYNDAFYLFLDDFTFVATPSCKTPTGLTATNLTTESATLEWTAPDPAPDNGYNVRYRTAEIQNPTFFDSFEDGLSQWTIIRNGEGTEYTDWRQFDGSFSTPIPPHSGTYMVMSRSWNSDVEYDVDNWLITPRVTLNGTLRFWVMDDGTYHEHYDVYVSTTGNTIADFGSTPFYEPGDASGEWTEVTVDLSSYAGAKGYVALRHTDYNQDFLLIDDFGIYGDPTPAGAWTNTTSKTNSKDIASLTESTLYDFEVQSNCGGETSDWVASTFTTLPSCMPVANLAVSDVTATTVSLTWTDQNSGSASYVITDGNDNAVTVTDLTTTGCTVIELKANTAYTFKVTADCGSTTETINVRTECEALSTIPYNEGFEASSEIIYCWDLDGFGRLNNPTYAHTGNVSLFSQDASVAYAILPTTTANTSALMLNFWYYNYYGGYDLGSLEVGYLTDIDDYTTFVNVGTIDMSVSYDEYIHTDDFVFDGAPDGSRIALRYNEGTDAALVIIDDVTVEYKPACMRPTDLVVTNPTGHGATFAWTNNGSIAEDGWQLYISEDAAAVSGYDSPAGVIDADTNPFTVTSGLDPETTYYVWVRSHCEYQGNSPWSDPATFTTTVACPAPTDLAASEITGTTAKLSWTGTSESYTVKYRTAAYMDAPVLEEDFSAAPSDWTFTQGALANDGTATLSGTSSWTRGTNCGVFDTHIYMNMYSTKNYWLITPSMTIADGYLLNFDMAYTKYSSTETNTAPATGCTTHRFAVLISTDDKATWTILREWNNSGSPYVLDAVSQTGQNSGDIDLSAYAGETAYIAFFGHSETTSYDNNFHFDNVTIGTSVPAGAWQTKNADASPYTLTGLTAETYYEAKVQGDCGSEGTSDESASVFFTTSAACPEQDGLEASNIQTHSAVISWDAHGATEWNLRYSANNGTTWIEITKAITNPYTLEGLDAATDYLVQVQAKCAASDEWSASLAFTTECDFVTTFPWSEDFESYTAGNFSATCWVNEHIAGSSTYVFQVSTASTGTNNTKKLVLPDETDGNMIKLVLPGMTLPNSNYAFLIDVYRSDNYSTYITEGIRVFASTNGEIEGATELAFIPRVYSVESGIIPAETTANSWYTYALPINMSGTCYIILRGESKYGAATYMDNFMVAACYPVGTLSYDNLASQTVDLHWTLLDNTQDAWQVCINNDEDHLIDITESDVVVEGVERTYSMSGLTAETPYTVKVRANCGGGDFGKWSNTISFSTLAACATPTGLAASNLTMVGADLAWTGSSDVDYYTVQYRTAAGLQTHYFEGFEDGLGDWTKVDCASSTGISTGSSYAHTGNAAFKFSYNTNPPQYLVSPAISGITSGMVLEFWYKNGSTTYPETFQVGFSSTDNDVASFAFEDEITASDAQWHSYSVAVPATTKYLCFKLNSNNQLTLCIDDITIGTVVTAGSWQEAANDVATWNYELTGLTASTKYDARVYANCAADPETENDMTTFTTLAEHNIVFPENGNWAAGNFEPTSAPTIDDDVIIRANATIPSGTNAYANNIIFEGTSMITVESGASLTINGNVTNGGSGKIYVRDGGQLIHKNSVYATVQKGITAPSSWKGTSDTDGWYLIATPVSSTPISSTFASTIDLFKYDEATAYWWSYNNGSHTFSYINRGTGYLNACQYTQTVNYAGLMISTEDTWTSSTMSYTDALSADVKGFNLMGNPFTRNLVAGDVKLGDETNLAYLTMNDTRTDFVTVNISDRPIKPGEGFFIQATATSQSLVFNPTSAKSDNNGYIRIVAGNENGSDNAYINLANGNTLRKFNIANGTKVYVMNGGEDYAAARVEELAGAIPVNFKAAEEGEYTITINAKNIDVNTMILVDDMTGEEIDLLVTPSYTFKATTNDAENRFKLIFDCNNYTGIDENFTGDIFAYQHGNEIIVNGEGTLEVFDVMGRMVLNTKINGVQKVNVPANAVYIFKLMGETVKTQKIVVR